MSEYRNPTGEPDFSTLEVSRRGDFSTLEVKPTEGIEPSNAPASTSQNPPEQLSHYKTKNPWWRRYWLLIVVVSLLLRINNHNTEPWIFNHLGNINYHILPNRQAYCNT
ncbi:hypothetical protein FPOAC2_07245 [Fusarium poae]